MLRMALKIGIRCQVKSEDFLKVLRTAIGELVLVDKQGFMMLRNE